MTYRKSFTSNTTTPTNIRDELSLSTDETRAAFARLILNADTVINFIQSLADDDEHDLDYYQRLARSILNTLQTRRQA